MFISESGEQQFTKSLITNLNTEDLLIGDAVLKGDNRFELVFIVESEKAFQNFMNKSLKDFQYGSISNWGLPAVIEGEHIVWE